jgi:hypothetical protein
LKSLLNIIWGDEIKDDKMGRIYSTHGEVRNACQIVAVKSERRRYILMDLGIDGG